MFVLDEIDRKQAAQVEALGMRPVVTNTIMRGLRERKALARVVVRELGDPRRDLRHPAGQEPAKRQAALNGISWR